MFVNLELILHDFASAGSNDFTNFGNQQASQSGIYYFENNSSCTVNLQIINFSILYIADHNGILTYRNMNKKENSNMYRKIASLIVHLAVLNYLG